MQFNIQIVSERGWLWFSPERRPKAEHRPRERSERDERPKGERAKPKEGNKERKANPKQGDKERNQTIARAKLKKENYFTSLFLFA